MIPNELLLADGTLHCRMFLEGKVAKIWHLVTPGFPCRDYSVDKLSVDAGLLLSISDRLTSSHPHSSTGSPAVTIV